MFPIRFNCLGIGSPVNRYTMEVIASLISTHHLTQLTEISLEKEPG